MPELLVLMGQPNCLLLELNQMLAEEPVFLYVGCVLETLAYLVKKAAGQILLEKTDFLVHYLGYDKCGFYRVLELEILDVTLQKQQRICLSICLYYSMNDLQKYFINVGLVFKVVLILAEPSQVGMACTLDILALVIVVLYYLK